MFFSSHFLFYLPSEKYDFFWCFFKNFILFLYLLNPHFNVLNISPCLVSTMDSNCNIVINLILLVLVKNILPVKTTFELL